MNTLSSVKDGGEREYLRRFLQHNIEICFRNLLTMEVGGIYGVDNCDRQISVNVGEGGFFIEFTQHYVIVFLRMSID